MFWCTVKLGFNEQNQAFGSVKHNSSSKFHGYNEQSHCKKQQFPIILMKYLIKS
jgi:hypothetical protein